MRTMIRVIQIAVGVLFIISGLVKANDPLGLSYKMQEFFELWNSGLKAGHFFLRSPLISLFDLLHQQSLALSIFMITLEIVAGVALIMGWLRNAALWLLTVLIVFFTFLTGYAYLSGKFTNCGCFGDCLPISPFTSFMKDIVLLVLILMLVAGRKQIRPVFTNALSATVMAFSLAASLFLQWYVLQHLPLADCLPFKKGSHIATQMKAPAGSLPDSFAIRFIYEKGGKQYEFAPENLPADYQTYKFVDRKDKLIRKGNADPAIKGFSLTGISGKDSLPVVLTQPRALIIFALDLGKADQISTIRNIVAAARAKKVPVYAASSTIEPAMQLFIANGMNDVQFFTTDFTIVRTAARTEPAIYLMENGTVKNKWGKADLSEVIREL